MLCAVDASSIGTTKIHIHSPHADVFVLALRRYPDLCENTSFVTGARKKRRVIPLKPIVQALGLKKLAAIPAFHGISGADNTGSFAGKGKLTCWNVLEQASDEFYAAMARPGTT